MTELNFLLFSPNGIVNEIQVLKSALKKFLLSNLFYSIEE